MNTHPEIALLEDGFALRGPEKEVLVSFADVRAIRAEKIDLFSFDEIRVTFERKKKEPVEISEESLGYEELEISPNVVDDGWGGSPGVM